MASTLEEELHCPVCHEVFKDPVIMSCSHSFCKLCLNSWWKERPSKQCPICKRRSSKGDPPRNLALKTLCEAFSQRREPRVSDEDLCKLHSEKLKLFCSTDQQPVCVVCRDSAAHGKHEFKPIEASKDLKESLQKSLQPLKERLKLAEEFKENCDLSLVHIKNQTRLTKRQIQHQFKKLHQFLLEEEEARMKALREEEEQKTQRMKDKMEAVSRDIEALSETIAATEAQLRAADVSFLLKYKAAVERVQRCPLLEEPQLDPGTLIDQAKHLGNLVFNIWSNMKKLVQYTPVILDPNTTHPALVLSDDLTSFTSGDEQTLPKNPERIQDEMPSVRVSVRFNSGSHSWDVEVGDTDWELGVATESGYSVSEEDEDIDEDAGWWSVTFSDGEYAAFNLDKTKTHILKVKSNLCRIRVHLECGKRKLTLYDADTNTRLHTSRHLYQQKVFPGFCGDGPLSTLPQKV